MCVAKKAPSSYYHAPCFLCVRLHNPMIIHWSVDTCVIVTSKLFSVSSSSVYFAGGNIEGSRSHG